ncbi:hypothetical protein BGY98DRAFT_961163 [Russula aff. rugulosa BPL654]|nr:hypothetical protein BGY98DRAFT_961163 [Russula aff. rugulosa BPL654]
MYALAFGAASTGVLHSLAHHMGIRPIGSSSDKLLYHGSDCFIVAADARLRTRNVMRHARAPYPSRSTH